MIRALLAICTALMFAAGANAEQVTVRGCVDAGVEAGCLVLKSGNKTYNITSATPKPQPGSYGTVTGKISKDPTTCMQGILLKPSTWKQAKKQC